MVSGADDSGAWINREEYLPYWAELWPSARRAAEFLLGTIDVLERHEGHLLNWYDTKTLLPLMPQYADGPVVERICLRMFAEKVQKARAARGGHVGSEGGAEAE